MIHLPIHTLLRRSFHAQRAKIGPCIAAEGLSPGNPRFCAISPPMTGCLQKELAAAAISSPLPFPRCDWHGGSRADPPQGLRAG